MLECPRFWSGSFSHRKRGAGGRILERCRLTLLESPLLIGSYPAARRLPALWLRRPLTSHQLA